MKCWRKDKNGVPCLLPNSKKRTLVFARDGTFDKTIVWLEGVDLPETPGGRGLLIAGGSIGTNSGISFSRDELQHLVDQMPVNSSIKIAGCNEWDIDAVVSEFDHYNDLVQCGPNAFCPSASVGLYGTKQCCTCEKRFGQTSEDGQCWWCGSGNWVEGGIEDEGNIS